MTTGKDLVIYILQNDLLDEPVVKNGNFIGFTSPEDAALKKNVGPATIDVLIGLGHIDCHALKDTRQIPLNQL